MTRMVALVLTGKIHRSALLLVLMAVEVAGAEPAPLVEQVALAEVSVHSSVLLVVLAAMERRRVDLVLMLLVLRLEVVVGPAESARLMLPKREVREVMAASVNRVVTVPPVALR